MNGKAQQNEVRDDIVLRWLRERKQDLGIDINNRERVDQTEARKKFAAYCQEKGVKLLEGDDE